MNASEALEKAPVCTGMPGPDVADPDTVRRMEERNELFRRAAVSGLAHGCLNAEDRRVAEHWARLPPLNRPLSDGSPATATTGA